MRRTATVRDTFVQKDEFELPNVSLHFGALLSQRLTLVSESFVRVS